MIDALPDDVLLTLVRACSTWHDTLPLRGLRRTTREQMIRLEYETAVEAMQRGAYTYIKKPWQAAEVKLAVERAREIAGAAEGGAGSAG